MRNLLLTLLLLSARDEDEIQHAKRVTSFFLFSLSYLLLGCVTDGIALPVRYVPVLHRTANCVLVALRYERLIGVRVRETMKSKEE